MKNLTIALIDDDQIDRLITRKLIGIVSPEITTIDFSSGQDALKYLNDHAKEDEKLPDIVILDIKMPLMTGLEYLEHFNYIKSKIVKTPRHYIYTSSIDPEDLNIEHRMVYGHYIKPFEKESLQSIIEESRIQ